MARRTVIKSLKTSSVTKRTPPEAVEAPKDVRAGANLPYNLKRELEEIMKNTGREIDLTQDIPVLERICDDANYPKGSWRNRWGG